MEEFSFPLVFNTDGGASGPSLAGSEDIGERAPPHSACPATQGPTHQPRRGPGGQAGVTAECRLNLRPKDGPGAIPRAAGERGRGVPGGLLGGETERMKCSVSWGNEVVPLEILQQQSRAT